MNRSTDIETLLDQIDMIEKRIKGERLRHGSLLTPLIALLASGDAGPLAARRASRHRIRSLERERDRLLGSIADPKHAP